MNVRRQAMLAETSESREEEAALCRCHARCANGSLDHNEVMLIGLTNDKDDAVSHGS